MAARTATAAAITTKSASIADYISPDRAEYLVDDAAGRGGLDAKEKFVILGDLNCDPVDGAGIRGAMDQLLKHPRVNSDFTPASKGGPLTVKKFAEQNADNRGDPNSRDLKLHRTKATAICGSTTRCRPAI